MFLKSNRLVIGWMAVVVSLGALPASAIELTASATLDDYVEYAIEHNPMLASAADRVTAARQVRGQVNTLPDPTVSVGWFAQSPETRLGPQEVALQLSQRLPFFGKLGLAGDVAEKDADIWARRFDERQLDLVRDIKRTYYDYYRAYRVRDVTRQERDIIRRMQEVAQVKYASGLVSQQDVLKAQLALSNLDNRLIALERELVTITTRMNTLLNRAPDAGLAVPRVDFETITMGRVETLYDVAREKRPELSGAQSVVEKGEKAKALARRQYYPDLTLSLNYITVGERTDMMVADNGRDVFQIAASVNLPIWFGKRRAGVREAEAMIAMARNERIGIDVKIQNQIEDTYKQVEAVRDQVRLYERVIIPQGEQTFQASEIGYQTGKLDFLNYLDSQRALLSFRQTFYGLQADLGRQYADLERAVGMNLKELSSR